MNEIRIRIAEEKDRSYLVDGIERFWLDDAGLEIHQFLIAEEGDVKLGFGRVREHQECSEMCTLGVEENARKKGTGSSLIKALTEKAIQKNKLYLVCIIPHLFEPLGFEIVSEYPEPMADKLRRCETYLSVPEKYVVMKYVR